MSKEFNEYIKTRLDDQINWHDKKSQSNQKYYKRLKIIEISLAVSLPLFIAYIDVSTTVKIIVSVMSVIIALVVVITGIYRFKEKWIEYRTTAKMLKHEKYLYLAQAVPYNNKDALSLLVQRVEYLIFKAIDIKVEGEK